MPSRKVVVEFYVNEDRDGYAPFLVALQDALETQVLDSDESYDIVFDEVAAPREEQPKP